MSRLTKLATGAGILAATFVAGARFGARHVNERRKQERSLTRSLAASRGQAYMQDEEGYTWWLERPSQTKRRAS